MKSLEILRNRKRLFYVNSKKEISTEIEKVGKKIIFYVDSKNDIRYNLGDSESKSFTITRDDIITELYESEEQYLIDSTYGNISLEDRKKYFKKRDYLESLLSNH